jgi:cytoskeletal protein RodZ
MPEIGATLREARMRARIDISEIEAETKIRAKYLRALENEEWGLLPGPAYVRSFLRTYAEALGLDGKALLEEYKLRYERPTDHDLMPIRPPGRRGGRYDRPPRGVPRGALVIVVVAALLLVLYLLGQFGNDDGGDGSVAATDTTTTRTATAPTTTTRTTPARRSATTPTARVVTLQIVPTGPVYVCMADAAGRLRVAGVTLRPGARSGIYRSKAFRIRLGNGNARLRVNGRLHDVTDASPVGYRVTRAGVQRVDVSQTPSCAR